ncbi:hypothetical protein DRO55_06275 [Candidatus Bathyarchaeota archaeon]|nr:MAG: hypothetical protein DRO55_06275 [Candidatus Bathyarchaeota archaeon]
MKGQPYQKAEDNCLVTGVSEKNPIWRELKDIWMPSEDYHFVFVSEKNPIWRELKVGKLEKHY